MNHSFTTASLDSLLRHLLDTSGLSLTYAIQSNVTGSRPSLTVEWTGDDVPMLTARKGELLLALEHVAAKAMRLEPEEHDLIHFEAGGFKANRERQLLQSAEHGMEQVRLTGEPYHFAPMSSHERRMLHLALVDSGLLTASEGEGAMRHLVLHPMPRQDRSSAD